MVDKARKRGSTHGKKIGKSEADYANGREREEPCQVKIEITMMPSSFMLIYKKYVGIFVHIKK